MNNVDKNFLINRAYQFSLNLIKFLTKNQKSSINIIIHNQLLRSGTSICANLTEATAASSKKEFKKFHEIALKSGNETKYWIYLLKDSCLASKTETQILIDDLKEINNMIASGIMKMKGLK